MERYINEFKKDAVESFYGKGSTIKIHNITFTQKTKSAVVEVVIVLGDVITESVMDEKMATTLVDNAMRYFDFDLSIHFICRWDV